MSRVGKQPIKIPENVEIQIEGGKIRVKGPKGELERVLLPDIGVEEKEGEIVLLPKENARKTGAMWGLMRSLIANMVRGVSEGFEKKLEFEGVGYRMQEEGGELVMNVGFSHPVRLKPPAGVAFSVEQNAIVVSGSDKEKVGQFAASIRKVRPVEPYKGKGIRYEGEKVRRKLGKRAAGEGASGAA